MEFQLLISVQGPFQVNGFDVCTRQHSIANMVVKASKCFEWNWRWIEAPLQRNNHNCILHDSLDNVHYAKDHDIRKNNENTQIQNKTPTLKNYGNIFIYICCNRQEPIAGSLWKIFHAWEWMRLSCASTDIIGFALADFALHMTTRSNAGYPCSRAWKTRAPGFLKIV